MICQILRLNLPTCLTAMSRKTTASTMMGMYVTDLFYCTMMRIVILSELGGCERVWPEKFSGVNIAKNAISSENW